MECRPRGPPMTGIDRMGRVSRLRRTLLRSPFPQAFCHVSGLSRCRRQQLRRQAARGGGLPNSTTACYSALVRMRSSTTFALCRGRALVCQPRVRIFLNVPLVPLMCRSHAAARMPLKCRSHAGGLDLLRLEMCKGAEVKRDDHEPRHSPQYLEGLRSLRHTPRGATAKRRLHEGFGDPHLKGGHEKEFGFVQRMPRQLTPVFGRRADMVRRAHQCFVCSCDATGHTIGRSRNCVVCGRRSCAANAGWLVRGLVGRKATRLATPKSDLAPTSEAGHREIIQL